MQLSVAPLPPSGQLNPNFITISVCSHITRRNANCLTKACFSLICYLDFNRQILNTQGMQCLIIICLLWSFFITTTASNSPSLKLSSAEIQLQLIYLQEDLRQLALFSQVGRDTCNVYLHKLLTEY